MKRTTLTNENPMAKRQRWFLSALLFAALGMNYYFQVSSNATGEFSLASTEADKKTSTQASTAADPTCPSGNCAKDKPAAKEAQLITKTEAEINAMIQAAVKKALEEKEAQTKKEEEKKETAKEKREREAQAKKDKEKEAQEKRNEEFEERAAAIADNCSDIECSSTQLTSLLEKFSGKKKVDQKTVTAAFNKYFAKDFRGKLYKIQMLCHL